MEKEEVGMTEEEKDKEEGGRGGGLGSGRKGLACGRRRATDDQVVLDDAGTEKRLERREFIE